MQDAIHVVGFMPSFLVVDECKRCDVPEAEGGNSGLAPRVKLGTRP